MGRVVAVAALAAILVGCGSGTPQKGLSVRIDKDPFRITLVRDGKTVVAQDKEARLRYRLASGVEHKLTALISSSQEESAGLGGPFTLYRVATDEPGRTAAVVAEPESDGFTIVVSLQPAKNVREVYDSFDTRPDEHFLGGGERPGGVDLRGQILPVKVSTACSYAPVPFFASSAGWGLSLRSLNVAALAFPGSTGGSGCRFGGKPACTFPALRDRAEVCIKGARLSEQIYVGTIPQTLADYQGPTLVPPPSELAVIKWRDSVTGPKQVLEDITRFQAAGIPLGWVLLDNPWETCVGSLSFDRARIPDPAALIREVHAQGVRFMLWVSPKILCNPGYPPKTLLGDPADQVELDLRNSHVVSAFKAKLRKLVTLGIDGVKADRGDEVDLEGINDVFQNNYPLDYARAVMGALPKDAAAIFRAATQRSQNLVPGIWAGDQDSSFDGLQQAIRSGLTAAMSGFATWGSDVGGYRELSTPLTAELFARWTQLGAVSPIMEIGGIGANATPWTLGPTAMTALHDAAVLHYELFPYMYGLLEHHQPVLRPLAYAYPDDEQAWKSDLEFLVGPDLFAAPVTGGGTTPSVYLPQGSWIDLYTGELATGGQVFTRPTPLTQFPFYVRDGAVLPFNLRTGDSWWGVDELTHPGRAGWLATNFARLDLRGQPRDVQVFVPAPDRPLRVLLGGRVVAWTWNAGPMPGVVVRVHGPTVRGEIVLSRT